MPFIFPPTRRTTPGQWIVAAWTVILILLLTGILAICYSTQAGDPAQAHSLRRIAYESIALAAIVWLVKRLIAIYLD
jgi:hypothetical protein